METLTLKINDGGRAKYFKAQHVDDCAVRAAAIAANLDYKEAYNLFKTIGGETPRNGVKRETCRKVMQILGGKWVPCMKIGSGCKVHLAPNEIPMTGRLIVSLSGHLCAVIDGVINDTFDPSRGGTRCVYGYWIFNN